MAEHGMGGGGLRRVACVLLAIVSWMATAECRGADVLLVLDEQTAVELQLLAGPLCVVQQCEVGDRRATAEEPGDGEVYRALARHLEGDHATQGVFWEGELDPIVAERLGNHGLSIHTLQGLGDRQDDVARCLRLRALCKLLVELYPEGERGVRQRLCRAVRELRNEALQRGLPAQRSPGKQFALLFGMPEPSPLHCRKLLDPAHHWNS